VSPCPRPSSDGYRDSLNEIGEVARLLELKPGMTVGDIGAGSGHYTVRLSHLVGPSGSIVPQDVMWDYLIELRRRTERLGLINVKFAKGEPHDPRLPGTRIGIVDFERPTSKHGTPIELLRCELPRLAMARSRHISWQAMEDTWQCSFHRRSGSKISPRYCFLYGSSRLSLIRSCWRPTSPSRARWFSTLEVAICSLPP
jgi:hypothetical protein